MRDLFARALSCILNGKLRNVCRSWRCSSSCCSWHIAEGESRINKEKSPSSFAAHKNFTSRRMFGSVTKWNNNRFLSSSALARCRQTSDFNFRKCRVHFKSLSLRKWSACGRPWACTFRSLLLWLLCDDNRLNGFEWADRKSWTRNANFYFFALRWTRLSWRVLIKIISRRWFRAREHKLFPW